MSIIYLSPFVFRSSKDQASAEEGRDGEKPKASSFESRANER